MVDGRKPVVVLLSGGMDSVTALYVARERYAVCAALSFDYGSKHNHRELPFAAWHCKELGIRHQTIAMPFVADCFTSHLLSGQADIPDGHYEEESMRQTVVPFRNGIMLAVAAGYAESNAASGVVIAAHSGDHAIYPDCREEFMQAMSEAIQLGTYADVALIRPFVDLTKGEIAKLGVQLGVNYAKTWSCYKGGELHCGTCGTCVERREAFMLASFPDPTEYAVRSPLPLPRRAEP